MDPSAHLCLPFHLGRERYRSACLRDRGANSLAGILTRTDRRELGWREQEKRTSSSFSIRANVYLHWVLPTAASAGAGHPHAMLELPLYANGSPVQTFHPLPPPSQRHSTSTRPKAAGVHPSAQRAVTGCLQSARSWQQRGKAMQVPDLGNLCSWRCGHGRATETNTLMTQSIQTVEAQQRH